MFGSELGIESVPLTTWSEHTSTDPPRHNKNEFFFNNIYFVDEKKKIKMTFYLEAAPKTIFYYAI